MGAKNTVIAKQHALEFYSFGNLVIVFDLVTTKLLTDIESILKNWKDRGIC